MLQLSQLTALVSMKVFSGSYAAAEMDIWAAFASCRLTAARYQRACQCSRDWSGCFLKGRTAVTIMNKLQILKQCCPTCTP